MLFDLHPDVKGYMRRVMSHNNGALKENASGNGRKLDAMASIVKKLL